MTPAGVISEALAIIDACGLDRTELKAATGPREAVIRRGRRPSGIRVTLTRRGVTWYVTGGGVHWKGASRHAAATQIAHILETGWR
nr:MAG TPA: hypothetical protein [Caudoviricetes sp.]